MADTNPDIDNKKLVPRKIIKKPLMVVLFILINVVTIAITAFRNLVILEMRRSFRRYGLIGGY